MKSIRKNKSSYPLARETELENYFKSAMLSLITVESAKYQAEYSEHRTLEGLSSLKESESLYVTAGDIPDELKASVTHASLNAHFQKVQASQMEIYNKTELESLNDEIIQRYKGRKISAKVIEPKLKPVLITMKDKNGRNYTTPSSARRITGIITKVDLLENSLYLRPTISTKIFNKTILKYRLFIINPANLNILTSVRFI